MEPDVVHEQVYLQVILCEMILMNFKLSISVFLMRISAKKIMTWLKP